ncbi:phage holin family protein [Chelativorans salis]|uniref:Phage holin family protein n=1 Tax=Chelativorans salis TaxID=2978478 RepID=A0ABT2LHQ5_9HYPH|nr:phage holin family protein [Chelativorans sp. EGI FJ00035]MCT7374095.1 phage holin family protein [Chelativorans sp. EGI FJ00035]
MTDHSTKTSTRAIVADVLTHLSNLIRGEIELARAEVTESIEKAIAAIGLIIGGVVIALTALNVLAAALVVALAEAGIPGGWAALIVGVALTVIALGLCYKGMNDLRPASFAPRRTARSLRRDAAIARESRHEH